MNWKKLSNYCIRSDNGRFRIAKWVCSGEPWYLLSDGDTTVGWYQKPDEAKKAAEGLANG